MPPNLKLANSFWGLICQIYAPQSFPLCGILLIHACTYVLVYQCGLPVCVESESRHTLGRIHVRQVSFHCGVGTGVSLLSSLPPCMYRTLLQASTYVRMYV